MTREEIKQEIIEISGLLECLDSLTEEEIANYLGRLTELKEALALAQVRDEALLKIAKHHSYALRERGDLTPRNNDEDDFIEVSVVSIEEMLVEAYELGRKEA